jgi:hypothetical protein
MFVPPMLLITRRAATTRARLVREVELQAEIRGLGIPAGIAW